MLANGDRVTGPRPKTSTEEYTDQLLDDTEINVDVPRAWKNLIDNKKCESVIFKFKNATIVHFPRQPGNGATVYSAKARGRISSLIMGKDLNVMTIDESYPDPSYDDGPNALIQKRKKAGEALKNAIERAKAQGLFDCPEKSK